ncbi:hypothetical protein OPV22_019631 [Ensete ventricosum]|uniref:Uncharacterized protein n=1 Tax=Ensete ventricosum TaxID=4639 RepID=A0AAV8QHE7_ENSVE|nr:hypothetical protein OPV22_019631 [Ensete ventricosum]
MIGHRVQETNQTRINMSELKTSHLHREKLVLIARNEMDICFFSRSSFATLNSVEESLPFPFVLCRFFGVATSTACFVHVAKGATAAKETLKSVFHQDWQTIACRPMWLTKMDQRRLPRLCCSIMVVSGSLRKRVDNHQSYVETVKLLTQHHDALLEACVEIEGEPATSSANLQQLPQLETDSISVHQGLHWKRQHKYLRQIAVPFGVIHQFMQKLWSDALLLCQSRDSVQDLDTVLGDQ